MSREDFHARLNLLKNTKSNVVSQLRGQLKDYDKMVKKVVKELNVKGKDAKSKSQKQVALFSNQIKKTRDEIETKISALVHQEAQRLNHAYDELLSQLKAFPQFDKLEKKLRKLAPLTQAGKGSKPKKKKTDKAPSSAKSKSAKSAVKKAGSEKKKKTSKKKAVSLKTASPQNLKKSSVKRKKRATRTLEVKPKPTVEISKKAVKSKESDLSAPSLVAPVETDSLDSQIDA